MDNVIITCKECRYWKEVEKAYSSGTHTVCDIEGCKSGDSAFEVYAESLDDQGLESALVTGPDFGCIHGEPKAP